MHSIRITRIICVRWMIFTATRRVCAAGADNLVPHAQALRPEAAPRMYVACGTQDFLFEANQAFIAQFGEKFAIRYDTEDGAAHTWDYWDREIEKVLAWLPLQRMENVW